ncbi:glycosyltransferase [Aliagarivorans taiwanensis]|uniref:glycosyltransferase n=1 Tax=Aliagarivorans taiwanensis TaxID=561966 RepID=UPI0004214F18|nr:glycosyltransferase [Aliagarivorans taiwanensis]
MKISIIANAVTSSGGGVSVVVLEHARCISGEVDCVIFSVKETNFNEVVDVSKVNLSFSPGFLRGRFSYFPKMLKQLKAWHPEIIHQHGIWNYLSVVGTSAKRLTGAKLVVSPHGMLEKWIVENKAWQKRVLRWLFQNENIQQADVLQVLTRKEILDVKRFGYQGDVALIPNGVELPVATSTAVIEGQVFKLLYIGRIDKKKNVITLVEAVSQVAETGAKLVLDIYGWGKGEYYESFLDVVESCANVNFHGEVTGRKKEEAFVSSHLFILPSFSEGLPMAILESWSYGLPTLMTKSCNLDEGFEGKCSIEIGTTKDSIANGILYYLSLPYDEKIEMHLKARELISSEFEKGIVKERLLKLYSWLNGDSERPNFVSRLEG